MGPPKTHGRLWRQPHWAGLFLQGHSKKGEREKKREKKRKEKNRCAHFVRSLVTTVSCARQRVNVCCLRSRALRLALCQRVVAGDAPRCAAAKMAGVCAEEEEVDKEEVEDPSARGMVRGHGSSAAAAAIASVWPCVRGARSASVACARGGRRWRAPPRLASRLVAPRAPCCLCHSPRAAPPVSTPPAQHLSRWTSP